MDTIVLLYAKICPADCSGWELRLRLPLQDLDVRRDVSVAPGGVLSLTSNSLVFHPTVGYAPGTPGLGLAKIFLLRLNRRRTPYYLTPTSWPIYSILTVIVIIVSVIIIAVRPLFKRNIYLSLLCDWIILSSF
jgi:hypothetical protein